MCVMCSDVLAVPPFSKVSSRLPSVCSTLVVGGFTRENTHGRLRKEHSAWGQARKGQTAQLVPPKWEVTHMEPAKFALEMTKAMGGRGQDLSKGTRAWALRREGLLGGSLSDLRVGMEKIHFLPPSQILLAGLINKLARDICRRKTKFNNVEETQENRATPQNSDSHSLQSALQRKTKCVWGWGTNYGRFSGKVANEGKIVMEIYVLPYPLMSF